MTNLDKRLVEDFGIDVHAADYEEQLAAAKSAYFRFIRSRRRS